MDVVDLHPHERIGKACAKARISLRSGDAGRIADFLGPPPWEDEVVLDVARRYVDALGDRVPDIRNRRAALKALVSAAHLAGRHGVHVPADPVPGRPLAERFDLAIPVRGRPLSVTCSVLLPPSEDLVDVATELAASGRRRVAALMEEEVSALGERQTARAARILAPHAERFAARVDAFLSQQGEGWTPASFLPSLVSALEARLAVPFDLAAPDEVAERLRDSLSDAVATHAEARETRRSRPIPSYDRFATLFPAARAASRKLLLIVGPTNSGKTHEALLVARRAKSAAVLSPLRLLALEHYEALSKAGLPAGMVTGEERILPPGATHVARTVEAVDLREPVEVAVIDEIQMLADPARGWAWTRAAVGVPAGTVVMTGSPDAVALAEAVAAVTGEPLEIRYLERKSPLVVEPEPVSLDDLRPGDAVIAFSRRDAMALRDAVRATGRSVAMVYGNLSPEVRRSEARRFACGAAGILVATDAVGMGLNLPIRRVVFAALEKYDGRAVRPLTDSEIRQVAGRAGRYGGPHAAGICAVLEGLDPRVPEEALKALPKPPSSRRLFVRPDAAAVSDGIDPAEPLVARLDELCRFLVAGHPDLRIAEMDDAFALAAAVDGCGLPLSDRFVYASVPLSSQDPGTVDTVAAWARMHADGDEVRPPDPAGLDLLGTELATKRLSAYLWLSRRFPSAYPFVDEAKDALRDANRAILGMLR